MRPADILNLGLAILGISGLFLSPRFLIPSFLVPRVSALLDNTKQYLDTHTDAIDAGNELNMGFQTLSDQFALMRMKSNSSLGILEQFCLATRHGLTCKLYVLSRRVKSIRVKAEMAVDRQRLASLDVQQSADTAESAAPAADVAIPIGDVAEFIPPPPAIILNLPPPIHLYRSTPPPHNPA